MNRALMQTIPFVEARYQGKKQRPKTISLRLSDTTSEAGAALGIVNYWHSSSSQLAYTHYVVDEDLKIQCVRDDVLVRERGIVCINVCGMRSVSMDAYSHKLLENVANLAANLCWEYGIPARYISLKEHRRMFRRGGIMCDVQSAWPAEHFLSLVNECLENYKEKGGL